MLPAFDPPPFEPSPLLRNGHVQTLAGYFCRWGPRADVGGAERREIRVDDETTVVALCDWQPGPRDRRPDVPVLVLMHGLSGDARSSYIVGTARKALAAGFHVVRLNTRNCGGTEDLTSTLYHGGLIDDVEAVVAELQREGFRHVFLAGFSLGGNQVLRLAGLRGEHAEPCLRGIVAVSPALDLADCADHIDTPGVVRFYRDSILSELKQTVGEKVTKWEERRGPKPPDNVLALAGPDGRNLRHAFEPIVTMRGWDDAITAPAFGFADASDYYARMSALPLVPAIRLPTLIIHARDDVMIPMRAFERAEVRDSPAVQLLLTRRGGHVGFLARHRVPGDLDRFWAEARLVDFCRLHAEAALLDPLETTA